MSWIDGEKVVAINEASSSNDNLTSEQRELHDELAQKFSSAWITASVGARISMMLNSDDQLGRFLKNNPNITAGDLEDLWLALWNPSWVDERVPLNIKDILSKTVHAEWSGRWSGSWWVEE